MPIFALNFLFGWTVIGWLSLLYWAYTAPKKARKPDKENDSDGPPSGVIFGDEVAFVPAIPGSLDVPFSAHSGFGTSVADGDWVNQGDTLRRFGMSKHDPECFKCRSEVRMALRLIDRGVHGYVEVPIYSPLSGLVIDVQDPFHGDDPDFLQRPNVPYEDRYHFMYAILLPRDSHVPETMGQSAAEFCNLCSQYRKSLFRARDYQKVSNVIRADEELVSNQRIDSALAKFRSSQIIIRSAWSLPDKHKGKIALLRQKHPTKFR